MLKRSLLLVVLFYQTLSFSQLCTGSSGAPIFFENFGSDTTYGPALPVGTTTYTYVSSGFPQDGQYTLYYRTNIIPNSTNWLYSLDHTADSEPNGVDGKCLIVNASVLPGRFYIRTVTGLCSNTTFEFSAWLLNILNPSGCTPGNEKPVNVRFEIWDATNTILLKSGSTGDINGTPTPIWNQFGLLFTMPPGETSVILKMINNGNGGCGNDLAIDDVMFRACGETSTITNVADNQDQITICKNTTITNNTIQVITTGTGPNVYQWQESNDNINFTDILGANAVTYSIPSIIANKTYYRVKVANDIPNLSNPSCSALSAIYTVNLNSSPTDISTTITNVTNNKADGVIDITGVTGGLSPYLYSIDGGPLSPNTTYTNLLPGNYTITVEDTNGCRFSKIVTVSSICIFPNAISPNNDSKNDTFKINDCNISKLKLFNRYGKEINNYNNYSGQWNGTNEKGENLPDGTYFYNAEMEDGTLQSGWVYISR